METGNHSKKRDDTEKPYELGTLKSDKMKKITTIILLGVIIALSMSNPCFAQFTKLHDFAVTPEGGTPYGSLISDGTFLYGMTNTGGSNGYGIIFKIKPDGTGYTTLLNFNGVNAPYGAYPFGSLISDGTFLYGMTQNGGVITGGVIFKIKPDGTEYTILYDFINTLNGALPIGSLIFDGTFLYGMAQRGGINNLGTVFKIKPDGTEFAKLLDFAVTPEGNTPFGSLISDGIFLYGMTQGGGTNGYGTIFKIQPDGTGYAKLLDFNGGNAPYGAYPFGSLITDGTFLYGMTPQGSTNNLGTIFKIKPDGTDYTDLFDFSVDANGSAPYGDLLFDGTFLYGMTFGGGTNNNGVIFKLMPNGSGYTRLFDFSGTTSGNSPWGSLISDGTFLYGMTAAGGTNNQGTIFKIELGTTGLAKNNSETGINIYPNPTNGKFTIQIANRHQQTANSTIEIYNVLGEKLYSDSKLYQQYSSEIDLSNSPKGIYFVKVHTETEIHIEKIVVE
jgi:uncharacterized repeat protein (TIGR03803 family)